MLQGFLKNIAHSNHATGMSNNGCVTTATTIEASVSAHNTLTNRFNSIQAPLRASRAIVRRGLHEPVGRAHPRCLDPCQNALHVDLDLRFRVVSVSVVTMPFCRPRPIRMFFRVSIAAGSPPPCPPESRFLTRAQVAFGPDLEWFGPIHTACRLIA